MAIQTGVGSFTTASSRPTQMGGASSLSQPAAVGDTNVLGYSENCAGLWITPPYQTFSGALDLAIWVDHQEGIDHVDILVDGGPAVPVSTTTRSAQYAPPSWLATIAAGFGSTSGGKFDLDGKLLYVQRLLASDYVDGPITVQAIAYPVSGVPFIVGDLPLNANHGGTIPTTIKWVASNGNDTTGNGSEATPYLTIGKAETVIGANGDNSFVYCKAGSYAYVGGTTATTNRGILTVQAAPGVSRDDVILTGFTFDKLPVSKHRRFKDVTGVDVELALQGGTGTLWLDNFVGTGTFKVDYGSFAYQTWTTNSYFHLMTDGAFYLSDTLAHNVVTNDIQGDAFHGQWAVNMHVHKILPDNLADAHTDILQRGTDPTTNAGMYGVATTGTVRAQAITNGCPLTDVMFRECDFSAITIDNNLMIAQACRNMVFTDCLWGNTNFLLTVNANPFTAEKVVFDNSPGTFDPALDTIDGVTVR